MQIAVTDLGAAASRFLTWWVGELVALVPSRLRHALTAGRATFCIGVSETEAVIAHIADGQTEEIGRIALEGKDENAATLRPMVETILRSRPGRHADTVFALPTEQVLRKSLDLPLAAESGLKDLLYFELDRQTPYRPEQIRYSHRIVERNPATQKMRVELVVVPKSVVDRVIDLAAAWGLTPAAITVAGADDLSDPAFDFAGDRSEGVKSSPIRFFAGFFAVLAAILLTAAVYIPLTAQREAAVAAEQALNEAMASATAASELRTELDRMAKAGNFLVEQKRNAPMMTAVLADLTRLFPDDTWLFELHIDGKQVRARGYSPAASSILELVERTSGFGNARFTSPVTRVPGIDRERFDLTFDLLQSEGS